MISKSANPNLKVVPMNPTQKDQGYSAGNTQSGGISTGKAILISAVSATAGAFLIRLMDRTVFAKEKEEVEGLRSQLAVQAGGRALPPAPQARPSALPPPGYVRIDVPKETMTDEFWARLAGESE